MESWCERPCCPNGAVLGCNKCSSSTYELPSTFGQFCSRECQFQAYASHAEAHKLISSFNTKSQSDGKLIESLAVAIKDAANRRLLPELRDGAIFSILVVGSTDPIEGSADFFRLYDCLVALQIYPPDQQYTLEVTLVGPELTSRVPYNHPSGKVTVVRLSGRLQRMFPVDATYNPRAACYTNVGQYSHTAHRVNVSQYMSFSTYDGSPAYAPSYTLSTHYHCAVLRNPGLGLATVAPHPSPSQSPSVSGKGRTKERELTLAEQWEPAVNLLLDTGLLTFVLNCCPETDKRRTSVAKLQSMLPSILPNIGGHNDSAIPSALLASRSSSGCSTPMTDCSPATARYKSIHSSPGSHLRKFGAPVYTPTVDSEILLGLGRGSLNRSHLPVQVAQDESVLDTDYWARIVIPNTRLPCEICAATMGVARSRAHSGDSTHSTQSSVTVPLTDAPVNSTSGGSNSAATANYPSGCMYLAFRGRRDSATSAQIAFYQYVAEHNMALRVASQQLASDLGTGRLHLPAETTQVELEQEAIRRNLVMHPEHYQQLGTAAGAASLPPASGTAPVQLRGIGPPQGLKGGPVSSDSPASSPQSTPQITSTKHILLATAAGASARTDAERAPLPIIQSPASHKKVHFQAIDRASPDDGYKSMRCSDRETGLASSTDTSAAGDTLITAIQTEGTELPVPRRPLPVMVFKRK